MQIELRSDKEQWLKELNDFVLDNERYFDDTDFNKSSDFKDIIKEKQNELSPSVPSMMPGFDLPGLLSKLVPPSKENSQSKNDIDCSPACLLFQITL